MLSLNVPRDVNDCTKNNFLSNYHCHSLTHTLILLNAYFPCSPLLVISFYYNSYYPTLYRKFLLTPDRRCPAEQLYVELNASLQVRSGSGQAPPATWRRSGQCQISTKLCPAGMAACGPSSGPPTLLFFFCSFCGELFLSTFYSPLSLWMGHKSANIYITCVLLTFPCAPNGVVPKSSVPPEQ